LDNNNGRANQIDPEMAIGLLLKIIMFQKLTKGFWRGYNEKLNSF
tara:strand:+ start:228 stop:362 length:135 start_codon:yes stop_codon:yes gene_type:complete